MTDLQLLGLPNDPSKTEIREALIAKVADLDFEIDIERIFSYIHCSQRLVQQIDKTLDFKSDSEEMVMDDWTENLDSPDALLSYFAKLYQNPSTRFNKQCWQSALDALSHLDTSSLAVYCKPIVDFLNANPFLKSDVLRLIADTFPFETFFPVTQKQEDFDREFWQQYGFVNGLLQRGNIEFDLHADTLNTGQFTTAQLDDLYHRLLGSTRFYRNRQYANAFNSLSDGIPPHVKPLLFWQRELNILYKAAFVEKEENLNELFAKTLNLALTSFPDDEQLIYLRCKFLFHQYSPSEFRDEMVATLRQLPDHSKCLFLLGKCYMQLGISRAALIIFENLKKLHPLNMQYVTATAVASRAYIDFCIAEHKPEENNEAYYIRIISSLIEQTLFDEIAVFAAAAPTSDPDVAALLLYAKDVEAVYYRGESAKNKEALFDALLLAKDSEIRRKIKEHYLRDLPNWSDFVDEKKFIQTYYDEYPNDALANYQVGMLLYAESKEEQAYHYFLKAKNIAPDNLNLYYYLAQTTADLGRHQEAIEYIKVYLLYNKYKLGVNQMHCEWSFKLGKYSEVHTSAKWMLSICRIGEFQPLHFYYLVAGLSLHFDVVGLEHHYHDYVKETLALFDEYPKPDNFWKEELGREAFYFAAKLSYDISDFKRCIKYVKALLQNVEDQNNASLRKCLFELLPKSLFALEKYAEIIKQIEPPAKQLFSNNDFADVAVPAFYISHAYGELEKPKQQMEWAMNCAHSYLQTEEPPFEWLENYLADRFANCLDHAPEFIIPLGKCYLENIAETTPNRIWIAHHLGNSFLSEGNREEAWSYHQKCLEYSLEFEEFPEQCTEERDASQAYINSLT